MKRYKRILLLMIGIAILIFIFLDMKAIPSFSVARPTLIIRQPSLVIL